MVRTIEKFAVPALVLMYIVYILSTVYAAPYILDGVAVTSLRQTPSEVSAVQNYPIGARLQIGQKVYYYSQICSTNTAADTTDFGLPVVTASAPTKHSGTSSPGVVATDCLATTVRLLSSGVARNQFQNGTLTMLDDSKGKTPFETHIISNDSAGTDGEDTLNVVTLDALPVGLTTSDSVFLTPNIYSKVFVPESAKVANFHALVGICVAPNGLKAVYKNYYTWVQTWGPCTIRVTNSKGGMAGARNIYYYGGFGMRTPDTSRASTIMDSAGTDHTGIWADSLAGGSYQKVGHYIEGTTNGKNYGTKAPAFLTISP